MGFLKRLWTEEDGATATEYAIIVAILGVSLIATFALFKDQIAGFFSGFSEQLSTEGER